MHQTAVLEAGWGGGGGGGGGGGEGRRGARGEGRGEGVRGRHAVVSSILPRPTPRALKIFRENGEANNNKMTFCFNPGRRRGLGSVAKRRSGGRGGSYTAQ